MLLLKIAALIVLGGALVASGTALGQRHRAARKAIDEALGSQERFVDFGVRLVVVRKDPDGKPLHGDDAVRVSVVREHTRGAIYDTLTRSWAGQSTYPTVWYLSEEQEAIVLHSKKLPAGVWMQGSMGAGKTTAGGIWLALRVIEHATHPLKGAGVTAPTDKRMEELRKTLFGPKDRDGTRVGGMWPRSWYTWREGDQTCAVVTGLQIDFRSTHIQSAAAGSPIQGQNWAFVLNDELQDYYELDGDIQMRGRAAWGGRYQRFVTVTPKDDPGYRTFREGIERNAAGEDDGQIDWLVQPVLGPNSPFIPDSHWEVSKRRLTEREFQRKVLALDLPSENRLYYTFDRKESIRPRPRVGAPDVTQSEIRRFGFDGMHLLMGHDPGRTVDVTLILKAFQLPSRDPKQKQPDPPSWWVLGEVVTERATTEGHCVALANKLRDWNQQGLIYCDPYGVNSTNDDDRPDLTVMRVFQARGFTIRPAAYSPGKTTPGSVPREARIDLVNTLFCSADGMRRLFIDCDDQGRPVAPRLVAALERQERDSSGKAERVVKGEGDPTHYTCALGYSLWPIEKPRLVDFRRVG